MSVADDVLLGLRMHGLPYKPDADRFNRWLAVCPSCQAPHWGMSIVEHGYGGPVTLRCSSGCTEQQILAALKAEPVDERVDYALALAEDARRVAAEALEVASGAVAELQRLQSREIAVAA